MTPNQFWLVFCPTGPMPPSYRHVTRASADREAERLAGLHRGQSFFVMEAVGFSLATNVETYRFENGKAVPIPDLPF